MIRETGWPPFPLFLQGNRVGTKHIREGGSSTVLLPFKGMGWKPEIKSAGGGKSPLFPIPVWECTPHLHFLFLAFGARLFSALRAQLCTRSFDNSPSLLFSTVFSAALWYIRSQVCLLTHAYLWSTKCVMGASSSGVRWWLKESLIYFHSKRKSFLVVIIERWF